MVKTEKQSTLTRAGTDRVVIILMACFSILSIATGVIAFILVRDLVKSWTLTELPGGPVFNPTTAAVNNNNNPGNSESTEASQPINTTGSQTDLSDIPTYAPWDGVSRVNILVMGLDYRDWEAGEVPRTDTMILLTVDPLNKTAGMLSIPRDMWVNIPGFNYGKINTAYRLGELYQVPPSGGPTLACETVEEFLGVPVHYYAQIDFVAFIKLIDEIGGVKLTIEEPITIYPLNFPELDGSKKVVLEPGRYRLPGNYVLAYARNRYTEGGDFDRAKRQQQVIMAVRDQVLDPKTWLELLRKAPKIYEDVSAGIRTNLTFTQIVQLGLLAKDINIDNIQKGIITPDMVYAGFAPDGQAILIPITDEIRVLRDQIFTSGGPLSPKAVAEGSEEDLLLLVQKEQARISVQNGSGTPGIAKRTAEYLTSQGLYVVEEKNADQMYDTTTLFIYNGTPYTIKYLQQLMNISEYRIFNRFDPDSTVDIAVMLGTDWTNNNPMP